MKKREKLEQLVTAEMIRGKHSRGIQLEKMLDEPRMRLNVVTATRDLEAWKIMIHYAKQQGPWLTDHGLVL